MGRCNRRWTTWSNRVMTPIGMNRRASTILLWSHWSSIINPILNITSSLITIDINPVVLIKIILIFRWRFGFFSISGYVRIKLWSEIWIIRITQILLWLWLITAVQASSLI